MADPLYLGHRHVATFTRWAPDRELNPQFADVADIDPCGVMVRHPRANGRGSCASAILFDLPGIEHLRGDPPRPVWTLVSLDPLHVEPSLLCRECGDHGFIRDGVWVPA